MVREPPPGAEHGGIAIGIGARLWSFIREHRLGRVVNDSGFILSEDPPTVRVPDVAFIAAVRIPSEGLPTRYFPGPPDLAVEIVSPSNTLVEVQARISDYLAAGTRLIWVVEPRSRTITTYRSDQEIRLLREDGELDGGDVVPGFRMGVKEVFDG